MTAVFVQGTGVGGEPGDSNWSRTIEDHIDFVRDARTEALIDQQKSALLAAHPGGKAQFWGTHVFYAGAARQLGAGDVVFFTGDARILAVARVGVAFDNADFGDTLWDPHPRRGSFRYVYSLTAFRTLDLPWGEFAARGAGPRGAVRGLQAFTGEAAEALLVAFASEIGLLHDGVPARRVGETDVQRQPRPIETGNASHARSSVSPGGPGADVRHETGGESALNALWGEGALVDLDPSGGDQAGPLDHTERLLGFLGGTDSTGVLRAARREQRHLRAGLGLIGDPAVPAQCGMCARRLPRGLLVAAHLKPRSECTELERVNPEIVMAACTLGCDALYEVGYISVGPDGRILTARRGLTPSHLHTILRELERRRAPAWTPGRERYFAWHRANRFRGVVVGAAR